MRFRTRGFISLLLAWSFLVAAGSGAVLYITPRGRVANWSGWTIGGLTKHEWSELHMNACLLMLTVAIVHLVLNWRIFWSYIRKKSVGFNLKRETAVSVLLTVAVVAGTLYEVPPLSVTGALNERMKDYWEERTPSGPAPHAEREASRGKPSDLPAGCAKADPDLGHEPIAHGQGQGPGHGQGQGLGQGQGGGAQGMGLGRGMGGGRGLGRGRALEEQAPRDDH